MSKRDLSRDYLLNTVWTYAVEWDDIVKYSFIPLWIDGEDMWCYWSYDEAIRYANIEMFFKDTNVRVLDKQDLKDNPFKDWDCVVSWIYTKEQKIIDVISDSFYRSEDVPDIYKQKLKLLLEV